MKDSSNSINYYSLLLFILIFFTFNGCSKEDDITITEPISLSAEKSQYAPYEIVAITASENLFTEQSFTAKINNIEINIVSFDNIASFVLPDLTNGNYDLSFTLNEKNYVVPITVSALTNILTADQYFNEITSGINQNINDLNSQIAEFEQNSTNPNEYSNLQNDIVKYTILLNEYTVSYNNLSEADKLEFAKSTAANQILIDEYEQLLTTLSANTSLLRNPQSIQDYESDVEAASLVFSSSLNKMAKQMPYIVAGAIIANTPIHPVINAGAILATGILVARFMVNVDKTITAAIILTNKSLKPYEFIAQTSETIYNNGIETISDIQAKYRSLINSDGTNGSNGSTINTIVEKYNFFKDKYNEFINELPSIFKPSYIMTSLKNTFSSTTRSIFNQYVSISNISNPNVTLQQLNQQDGSIKIRATTTATTDQTFTYKVNYTNGNFTSGLTQTVNAKVTVESNEYWSGLMTMTNRTMIQDCPDNNQNGINDDCGTGGCQSGTRALFGSMSNTSAVIKFAYSATHPTNNFQMALIVGGTTTANLNTCYTSNIQPNQNFTVGINFYAPDSWGGGVSASLQNVNFSITNQTNTTIQGTWSGIIQVSPLHCIEDCSGTWSVSATNIPFSTCNIIPSN